ncbi:MAG TPA: hypothetical protein VKV39_15780 [Candidatus Sulfotelmatobacter sp.]|nr:hypothetical protein [Candidatus Sulfotelmatobacter sp.]
MRCATFVKVYPLIVTLAVLLGNCPASFAQGPAPDAPAPAVEPSASTFVQPVFEGQHKFFDKWNIALFSTTGALAAADFAATRSNLQSNGKELNPVVRIFGRSTAGLAMNFAGEFTGSMGLSYFFHKTGHHKLERAVSGFNIGGSAFAVGYSLSHR